MSRRRKKDGKPKIIQEIPLNLKKEPFSLDWKDYKYIALANKEVSVHLSRGCSFSCAFCMESAKGTRKWRCLSVEHSISEIEKIIDTLNPQKILIMDACFGYHQNWRRGFLKGLIKRKINKLFYLETKIDLLEKEDIDLFSKLNFVLDYGIESASLKMLQIMKKTHNPKRYLTQCKEILAYTNKKRVYHRIHLLFNHPGEDQNTYKETIQFFKNLLFQQKQTSAHLSGKGYFFTPGSDLYHHLNYYQKAYGTVVLRKEWWKEKTEQSRLATSVIASRDFINRLDYQNYWKKEYTFLESLFFEKMASKTKLLCLAFWKDMQVLEHKKIYKTADESINIVQCNKNKGCMFHR